MVDPEDMKVTENDQRVALALMNALVRSVSEDGQIVSSRDVHRVLALMAGMVLETDVQLTAPSHFRKAGAYVGEMVAMFAKLVRDEHERLGVSMMDLAAHADGSTLN